MGYKLLSSEELSQHSQDWQDGYKDVLTGRDAVMNREEIRSKSAEWTEGARYGIQVSNTIWPVYVPM